MPHDLVAKIGNEGVCARWQNEVQFDAVGGISERPAAGEIAKIARGFEDDFTRALFTPSRLFNTRSTVALETPAVLAMSLTVERKSHSLSK